MTLVNIRLKKILKLFLLLLMLFLFLLLSRFASRKVQRLRKLSNNNLGLRSLEEREKLYCDVLVNVARLQENLCNSKTKERE